MSTSVRGKGVTKGGKLDILNMEYRRLRNSVFAICSFQIVCNKYYIRCAFALLLCNEASL